MNKDALQQFLKDPKKLAVPALLVFIIMLGFFLASSAKQKKVADYNEYLTQEKLMEVKRKKLINIPSPLKINQLKEKYRLFEKILDDTLYTFKSQQKEYSPLRPLQFKEELLKNQEKLETMPGGFVFPRGMGMLDYLETKVPRDEKLPELTKEMYVIYEVMRILYKNNVDRVTNIERFEKEKEYFKKSRDQGRFFKIFSVRFEAESDFLNFMEAFREMAYSTEYFIVVDQLNMKKVAKDKVQASFVLHAVEFY